jgi:ribosomal-protein-alanine N-acetyltransferase
MGKEPVQTSEPRAALMAEQPGIGRIQPVSPREIPQIAAIEQAVFSEPWTEAGFFETLTKEGTLFLALMAGESVVAYALMYITADEGEIPTIAVDPHRQRQGWGEALLREMIRRSSLRGVRQIFLEVRQSNRSARGLYEKCGFCVAGRRRDFYRFPREDALIMVRDNREDVC